jgi:hypothetical protein
MSCPNKINEIPYWPDASGFTGIICGQYYGLKHPQDFLNVANEQWPHLLFKLAPRHAQDGSAPDWAA